MNFADPFKQLVERKLWPIALLLVIALVAIPMLLSKPADDEGSLPPTTVAPTAETADASVVTVADAAKTDKVRAVLGDRKDPFRPAQLHHVKKLAPALTKDAGSPTTVDNGGSSGGGGATAGGETTPAVTVAPTATPAPKTFDLYSLEVRFGSTDGELATRNVKRLTGLPGGTHPAALYLGLLADHKSAVFLIDAGVQTLGDGHCDPSPQDCQTLTLKKGETEFLTRGDKQFELDLVDIHVKKTTDAKKAKESRKTVAVDGRRKLKGLMARVGRLRYDESAGTLRKASKAEVAKASARAASLASFSATG